MWPGLRAAAITSTASAAGQVRPWLSLNRHWNTGLPSIAHTDATARFAAESTRLAVEALVQDPDARERISTSARQLAAGWTTEANIDLWADAWNSA